MVAAIPMEGNAVSAFSSGCVKNFLCPIENPFFVVIPNVDFDVFKAVTNQRRFHLIYQKIPFFFTAPQTAVPRLNGMRFVLQRDSVNSESAIRKLLNVSADIFSPICQVFRLAFAPVLPLSVRFEYRRG